MSAEGNAILGAMPPLSAAAEPTPGPRDTGVPDLSRAILKRPWRYRPGVALSALLPAGTRPMDPGAQRLRSLFEAWPQAAMWLIAVDLQNGQRVAFGRDAQASVGTQWRPRAQYPATSNRSRSRANGTSTAVRTRWSAWICSPGRAWIWSSRRRRCRRPTGWPGIRATRRAWRCARNWSGRRARSAPAGTRVLTVAPDARMRAVMGTNSMVVTKRAPVALAAREYANAVFRREL